MARDINSNTVTELSSRVLRPILLLKLDLTPPSTFWSGVGEFIWGGDVYVGAGGLARITTVKEQTLLHATGTKFELTGIPSDKIALALTAEYQDKLARLWLALTEENLVIIGEPILLFLGRLDIMDIAEDGETASIAVTAENRLIDLERPRIRYYTDVDQKEHYPGDKGLEFVISINDGSKINWGREG